ncbi:MAG TPA: hypothetical protein VN958_04895 [Chitinophagaceae bacterium]|nr:hypothetical protein [Chitinophagaceae bacterium]
MKKIFSILAIFAIIITSKNAGAQQNNGTAFNAPIQNMLLFSTENSPKADAADVNEKAVKDFTKSFKNISGEQWYKVSDGFIASFKENGIETKVAYDQKGRWHCTVRTSNESQLPSDVRDLVKSRYYDFKILVVYEIKHDNTVYILKMEDASTLKTLRVADGEIEIIADNTRG